MSVMPDREKLLAFAEKSCFYYDLPGLAVSVGTLSDHGERANYGRAVAGFRDFALRRPLLEDHIFQMASITKLFTGTALLQLWEKGKVELDAALTNYLPGFTMADSRYKEITLRHILSHTAGLPNVADYHLDAPEIDQSALLRYVLSPEVSGLHLLWEPGQGRFFYSDIGYEILGCVIAAVSGQTFEDYVTEHILRPLEMTHSALLSFQQDLSMSVTPHGKDSENHIVPLDFRYNFPYNRAHGPSSALTSTLSDMEKWAAACLSRSQLLLQPATWDLAWTPAALVPDNGEHLCLSWFRREQEGYALYGHEGTDYGFRASFWLCPELQLWLTVCSNITGAPTKKIAKELFALLM